MSLAFCISRPCRCPTFQSSRARWFVAIQRSGTEQCTGDKVLCFPQGYFCKRLLLPHAEAVPAWQRLNRVKATAAPSGPELQALRNCLLTISLQHVEHFWLTKREMFCAGAGSIPGKVGFLQISFAAAELWAHRTLYLMISLLSSEVFCLSPEQCHCAVTSMLLCLSGPAFS